MSLIARLALRRLLNRLTAGSLRKRRHDADGPVHRSGTPRKGRRAGGLVMVALPFIFLNVVMLSGKLLSRVVDATTDRIVISRWDDIALQRAAEAPSLAVARERLEEGVLCSELPEPERPARKAKIVATFERLGVKGFRLQAAPFQMVPEIGPDERLPFARGVALLLCLLSVAILFSQLGSVNQDLGATDWSIAWMFSFPASTKSLMLAKILEYAIISPYVWLMLVPTFLLLGYAAGSWLGVVAGLLLAVQASLIISCVRLSFEVWSRTHLGLRTIRNLQATFTVTGVIGMYAALYCAMAQNPEALMRGLLARAPTWMVWAPSSVSSLTLLDAQSLRVGVGAAVGWAVIAILAALMITSHCLAGGLMRAGGGYLGSRKAVGTNSGWRPLGITGREVLRLRRDRPFFVQVALVPILVVGFQLAMNPLMLAGVAKGANPSHGAMLAFGLGAYVLMMAGFSLISSEGRALWLVASSKKGLYRLLRGRVVVWAGVAGTYTLAVLTFLGVRGGLTPELASAGIVALIGIVPYAFIAGGLGVLAADPLAGPGERRSRPATAYLYMILVSLYAQGVYVESWHLRVGTTVLVALLAIGIWERVARTAPFLLDPESRPAPRLELADAAIAILLFLNIQGMLQTIASSTPTRVLTPLTIFALSGTVALLISLVAMKLRGVPDLSRALGLGNVSARASVAHASVGIGLGVMAGAAGLAYLYVARTLGWVSGSGASSHTWVLILGLVLAPVTEEILFRGMLQGSFRRLLAPRVAIVAAAMVFALAHPVESMLPVFGLGLAAGLGYARTRWLVTAIVVHVIYNAMVMIGDSMLARL